MENLSSLLLPVGTIFLIVFVQISFWFPTKKKQHQVEFVPRNISTTLPTNSKSEARQEVGELSKKRETRVSGITKRIISQDIPIENFFCIVIKDSESSENTRSSKENKSNETSSKSASKIAKVEGKGRIWKCACEYGILPAGIMKTFGNAEAMMRLGVGQCYHKK